MKKLFILALASLFAFASCSKESNETPEVKDENTVNLTFTSKRPQLKSESKTAWDGNTIVWSEGDKIRVGYTLNGNWRGQSSEGTAKFYASDPVSIIDETNKNVGTFNVPISSSAFTDPKISGQYQFFSIYPSNILTSTTVNNPEAQSITLPATQHIVSGTFDSSADVMLGQSSSLSLSGLPTEPISLTWTRLVAHADLTFSNIAFEGSEIVSKITLTFNEEAKVAGSFSVNFVDGTAGAGSENVLTLSSDEGIASSSSSFKAWACVLPVTFTSLDVEIKTDKATYTRSISGISKTFKQNSRNTLTINMSTATRTAAAQYEWVEKDLSEITSSDVFVIVGNNGGTYAMSNENGTSSDPSAVHVTVSDNKLSAAPSESIQWTLSKDGSNYTFYPYGSTTTWLYCNTTAESGSNKNMRVGTGNRKAFVLDNNNYLVTNDTYTARYISVYNGEDWRGYVSKTNTVSFYVKTSPDTRADAELSFTETSFNVNVGDDFTAPTLTNPHNLTVTYSSSNEDLAVVDENTGVVLIDDNAGTVTITASFAGNDTYKAGSASYTITITDPSSTSKTYTITWNSTNNSGAVTSYTDSWSVTADGLKCNMQNWNNNNNVWNYVKAGRKNNASVATIITDSAIPEAIKTVKITIDALTSDKINSIKLYTSSDKNSWIEAGSFAKATGEQSVTISPEAINKYYKLEFDCASGTSNGLVTLSKLIFTTE